MRKPVAYLIQPLETGVAFIACCDDGSTWIKAGMAPWTEGSPIPGTQRDTEKLTERAAAEQAAPSLITGR
jgi:hypothetical protein